jgi:sigma-B regulation protein RsbU (phosphoserine phosphatase)
MNDLNPEINNSDADSILPPAAGSSVERLLIETSHILNLDLNLESLLRNILSILTKYLNAEASAILLLGSNSEEANISTYITDQDPVCCVQVSPDDKGIYTLVLDKKAPLIINEFPDDDRLKNAVNQKLKISTRNLMATPILRKDKLLGVIEVFNKKGGRDFNDNDLEIMNALGEQIALAIANANLIRKARRKSDEAKSLYELGKLLSGTLELEKLLQLIVDQVSRLVRVDIAAIYIVNPQDGSIQEIVSKGVPEEYESKLTLKIGQGICGWVAKTGQSVMVNDVSGNSQYIPLRPETKSEVAVPLISRDKVIGVFNVESDKLNAYSQADLELLETFASQAAVSVERAILYQQSIERKALEEELAIARKIQKTFLPEKDPVVAGFDISGLNIPSEAVGGDYYDFIRIVDYQIGIAIGDVSGKGIGAALIMATFRASLKAEIRNNYAIRTIFGKVNSLLFESIERENYVTSVYGVLDLKNRVFTFSNAGHNAPLLFRTNGEIMELTEGGLALGMFADSKYEERPVYINHGDMLLFYTDGVTEALNEDDEEFGLKRLQEIVKNSSSAASGEIIKNIIQAVQKYRDPEKPSDDLTMIMVKCLSKGEKS